MTRPRKPVAALALGALFAAAASAQAPADSPAALIAAQRDAMAVFARMDGVWRGPAWTMLPNGQRHSITQTERIGPFLDGSVKVLEGRGYETDGRVSFNALGIVWYDPASKSYKLRSWAQGHSGEFDFRPTADGYAWEIPIGDATIRYTAVIRDGTLKEVGDRVAPGRDPVRFFEMELRRVSDSDWPGAGAVAPK
jgi:hypothetical protein